MGIILVLASIVAALLYFKPELRPDLTSFIEGIVVVIALEVAIVLKWEIDIFKRKSKIKELDDVIERLEKRRERLKDDLEYKLRMEYKKREEKVLQELEAWKREQQNKFNQQLNTEKSIILRQYAQAVANTQEQVYKNLPKSLEKANRELRQLRHQLRQKNAEIRTLKGRMNNHVISIVKQAKREILIHALKNRPDKRQIANVLK